MTKDVPEEIKSKPNRRQGTREGHGRRLPQDLVRHPSFSNSFTELSSARRHFRHRHHFTEVCGRHGLWQHLPQFRERQLVSTEVCGNHQGRLQVPNSTEVCCRAKNRSNEKKARRKLRNQTGKSHAKRIPVKGCQHETKTGTCRNLASRKPLHKKWQTTW